MPGIALITHEMGLISDTRESPIRLYHHGNSNIDYWCYTLLLVSILKSWSNS